VNLRDEDYLNHVLDAISSIESYVEDGETAFMYERKTQDAVIRNLEIIGEAVNKLSSNLQASHPDIPWADIVGMRNRLIHGYLTVDLNVVWSTVEEVLPSFKTKIVELLGSAS
jgi:uncharacterized protein with HEPN domain